jgi:hypothetical protein
MLAILLSSLFFETPGENLRGPTGEKTALLRFNK